MLRKFILLTAMLLCAPVAHAQSVAPDPVQYIVSPEQPGPNQQVYIEVQGVGQFLGEASITWQENGKTVEAAQNKTTFSFTTGGIGSATRISVRINSPTQGLISRDFVFNPSVVNMVWEADTYTPLLYRGKSLYTAGSPLKIVAYPTVRLGGALVPASKLSFQWRRNDTPDTASSGLGKNVLTFMGDQLQNEEHIAVTVYSGTTAVARGEITIPASNPHIIFYVQDPLRGQLLGQGMTGSATLSKTELTFKAESYFFSNSIIKNNKLTYTWMLGNEEVQGPDSARGFLTLRQTGTDGGSATLSVSAQSTNTSTFVQEATASLQLLFGTQNNNLFSSFFGL